MARKRTPATEICIGFLLAQRYNHLRSLLQRFHLMANSCNDFSINCCSSSFWNRNWPFLGDFSDSHQLTIVQKGINLQDIKFLLVSWRSYFLTNPHFWTGDRFFIFYGNFPLVRQESSMSRFYKRIFPYQETDPSAIIFHLFSYQHFVVSFFQLLVWFTGVFKSVLPILHFLSSFGKRIFLW